MFAADFSEAFTLLSSVRHHYLRLVVVVMWLIVPGVVGTFSRPFGLLCLMLAQLRAQTGYLHLCSACLRWSSSLLSNCGLEQTVLALCVKVLRCWTWQPSWGDCSSAYTDLWVDFLCTVVLRRLPGSGITSESKKGMDPSALVSANVKLMCGYILLICSRNPS